MKQILKMANKMVRVFKYECLMDLTVEDLRSIAVETGQPFGIVAMLVYEQAYSD